MKRSYYSPFLLFVLSLISFGECGKDFVGGLHCNGSGEANWVLIWPSLFDNELFPHRNDSSCEGKFYTFIAFIEAAKSFPSFACTGDVDTRKRELAAFLAQTAHETSAQTAPDGPYEWGYCLVNERDPPIEYCDPNNTQWPCAAGKRYYGRGPMQISWNYNYGQAGDALQLNLLVNPDLVVEDPIVSFKTALWFWMTPQSPKPSCHAVMTGQWEPTEADIAAGRQPGYGVTTNIINGGIECGKGENEDVKNRMGFYQKFCEILGVSPGDDNLDCYTQQPFNLGFDSVASMK